MRVGSRSNLQFISGAGVAAAVYPVITSLSLAIIPENAITAVLITGRDFDLTAVVTCSGGVVVVQGVTTATTIAVTLTTTGLSSGLVTITVTNDNLLTATATIEIGTLGALSFSDTFVRATLGPNWEIGYFDNTQASLATCSIAMTGTNIRAGNSGAGGTNINLRITPLPVFALNGLTQFAALQWVAGTGNANIGPGVACTGQVAQGSDPMNGYTLAIRSSLNRLDLFRADSAETTIQTNITTFAIGDIAKLSVTFLGASNDIRIYKNGTLITTINDANAARPSTGIPCILVGGAVAAALITFNQFSCGPTA